MQLKDLPKQKQVEYTTKLLDLYKEMQSPAHTCDWSDIIQLREVYGLEKHSKDSLRRSIILKELIDAEMIIPNTQDNNLEFNPKTFKQSTDYTTNRTTSEAVLPLSIKDISDSSVLLKAHGFNPDEFNLLKARHSLWQQGSKENDIKDLISSKIEVEPKAKNSDNILTKEYFEKLFDELMDKKEGLSRNVLKDNTKGCFWSSSKIAVFYSPDLHFGRNSSMEDTGVEWNLEKSILRAKDTVNTFVNKMQNKNISEVVYVINSDSLNSEMNGRTTSLRNKQDNSTSMTEIYKQAVDFYVWAISKLRSCWNVNVYSVTGNHSFSLEYTLGLLLQAWFRNDAKVKFDIDATPRKCYTFGDNMICFCHGDKEGNRLKDIIPNEYREEWGTHSHRYVLQGHTHHLEWVEENNGLNKITLPTIIENDKYTQDKGYLSEKRNMILIFNNDNLDEIVFLTPTDSEDKLNNKRIALESI